MSYVEPEILQHVSGAINYALNSRIRCKDSKRTKYRWNEQASEEVNVNAEYSVSDPNSKEGDIPNLSNEEDDDIHNPNSMEDNVPDPSSEEEDVTDPSSEEEDVHNTNSEWGDNSSALGMLGRNLK
ncbi:hypothetical protein DPEC_G00207730 [Dallia pectoralis]|uniref:Uncharacterized protein n=1 Tax=Dallia pectoralis TaxID=75939 RepID=A0ACC2G4Z3_DALPE|nr:hypothetical protein DPEC_G00207730 [Dallia pectoralis]